MDIKRIRNSEELIALLPELTSMTRGAFGSYMTDEDVAHHVLDVPMLYLLREQGKVIGFAGYTHHADERRLHLEGIAVARDAQQRGIFRAVNEEVLRETGPQHFTMRTQNPAIYAGTMKLVERIYPDETLRAPQRIREIARSVGGDRMGDDFVVRGIYGTSLYGKVPEHPVKRFFDERLRLDYARGDAVIIVGAL